MHCDMTESVDQFYVNLRLFDQESLLVLNIEANLFHVRVYFILFMEFWNRIH